LIDRYSGKAKEFYGAKNVGTVTLAEMWPYIDAMTWYTGKDGPGRARRREVQQQGRNLSIHIVTDSKTVATCGNNPDSRQEYQELWRIFDDHRAKGYGITFHHIVRMAVNLNILMDHLSRESRVDLKETWKHAIAALQKECPGVPSEVTIYDFF
jgi:hypothetical protein